MKTSDRRAGPTNAPNINVTPLIDILLVLLIIFMVITPLRPARFRVEIPALPPDNKDIKLSPRTLIVSVGGDFKLKLMMGRELIAEATVGDPGAVSARLAREFDERKEKNDWKSGMENRPDLPADARIEKTVFIKAPRSIWYGEVARVIDGVKGAGAFPIGLQTDELLN
jgi:biopolymer transport protein ExbD